MSLAIAFVALLATCGLAASGAARAEGDPETGRKVFQKCSACHRTEPGRNGIGPSLHGVIDRQAGSVSSFSYSPALKGAGLVWTADNLDKWLQRPQAMVPGTKMGFPGLPSAKDRADVIAYLRTLGR